MPPPVHSSRASQTGMTFNISGFLDQHCLIFFFSQVYNYIIQYLIALSYSFSHMNLNDSIELCQSFFFFLPTEYVGFFSIEEKKMYIKCI